MKSIINVVGKAITRTIVARVIKDYIAADMYAKSVIATIPENERGFIRACKRIGMSDIQIIKFLNDLDKETEGYFND